MPRSSAQPGQAARVQGSVASLLYGFMTPLTATGLGNLADLLRLQGESGSLHHTRQSFTGSRHWGQDQLALTWRSDDLPGFAQYSRCPGTLMDSPDPNEKGRSQPVGGDPRIKPGLDYSGATKPATFFSEEPQIPGFTFLPACDPSGGPCTAF